MALSLFGRLLVSLGAMGIVYAVLTRRRSGVPTVELVGAFLACAGGELLGLVLLVAAARHGPVAPPSCLLAAAIIATGTLLVHWPRS